MITDQDIEKLKQVFATKEDLNRFATKEDLHRFATKEDLNRFATKEDLKEFATKEDLKSFVTKEELHEQTATIAEEFKGMLQLMSEMEQRLIDRMDQKFARQDEKFDIAMKGIKQQFKEVNERNRQQDEKFYKLLEKMNDQYSILFNQEKRIAKVEHKLFPAV